MCLNRLPSPCRFPSSSIGSIGSDVGRRLRATRRRPFSDLTPGETQASSSSFRSVAVERVDRVSDYPPALGASVATARRMRENVQARVGPGVRIIGHTTTRLGKFIDSQMIQGLQLECGGEFAIVAVGPLTGSAHSGL